MREYHPTNIQKYLGYFGRIGALEVETLAFNAGETSTSRDNYLVEILTVSIDGQSATATHDVDIEGSLDDGTTYSLLETMTTGSLTPGGDNYKERQILTIPATPRLQLRMKDIATKQALFYVTVLI